MQRIHNFWQLRWHNPVRDGVCVCVCVCCYCICVCLWWLMSHIVIIINFVVGFYSRIASVHSFLHIITFSHILVCVSVCCAQIWRIYYIFAQFVSRQLFRDPAASFSLILTLYLPFSEEYFIYPKLTARKIVNHSFNREERKFYTTL